MVDISKLQADIQKFVILDEKVEDLNDKLDTLIARERYKEGSKRSGRIDNKLFEFDFQICLIRDAKILKWKPGDLFPSSIRSDNRKASHPYLDVVHVMVVGDADRCKDMKG